MKKTTENKIWGLFISLFQLAVKKKSMRYQIIGEPRTTGNGYYESVVLDPEKNIIEITV